jgi:hypothetical protein
MQQFTPLGRLLQRFGRRRASAENTQRALPDRLQIASPQNVST